MGETVEINLRELGKAFLKRAWLIVLCAAILGAAVLVYTVNFVTPLYQADVTLYVNNNSNVDGNTLSSTDLAVALRLVNTYVEIIKRDAVLDKVIDELGLNLTTGQLSGMISAQAVEETEIFRVTVTTPNPQMSADIANAIAQIAPGTISDIIDGSNAKVIDYARVPTGRSSPNYIRNAMLGVVVGAVLAMAFITVQQYMNVRIKSEEDLQRVCNVPVLGTIPDFTVSAKRAAKKARR